MTAQNFSQRFLKFSNESVMFSRHNSVRKLLVHPKKPARRLAADSWLFICAVTLVPSVLERSYVSMLFTDPIVCHVTRATANFTFMGVSLNISGLFGDPYLNGVISGVIEATAILLASAGLQRMRRKVVMMALWGIIAAAGFIPIPGQVLRGKWVKVVMMALWGIIAAAGFISIPGQVLRGKWVKVVMMALWGIMAAAGFTPIPGQVLMGKGVKVVMMALWGS